MVVPSSRSCTKTFDPLVAGAVLVMLLAWESKATKRPSPESAGLWLSALDSALELLDEVPTEARIDRPIARLHTKMFERPAVVLVDRAEVRLLAVDSKATKLPSLLTDGFELLPFTAVPPWSGVTTVMVPPCMSRMKILMGPVEPTVPEVVPLVVVAAVVPTVVAEVVADVVAPVVPAVVLTVVPTVVADVVAPVVPDVVPPETKSLAADWNATKCPSPEMLAFVLSALAAKPPAVALTSWT